MTFYKQFWSIFTFCLLVGWSVADAAADASPTSSPPTGAVSPQTVSHIIVDIRSPRRTKQKLIGLVKELIPIRQGEGFSAQDMKQSLEILQKTQLFESIHADIAENGSQVQVMFQLTPFRRIKKIRILHAFPLFERSILNAMTVQRGAAFREEQISRQADRIVKHLMDEGYISPAANISSRVDPEDGHIRVDINLDKGEVRFLDKLTFDGNSSISDRRLRMLMDISPSMFRLGIPKRFKEAVLESDIEHLIAFYREKGFADCSISYETSKTGNNGVHVLVHIGEGDRYRIRFAGNKSISDRVLNRDLVLFESGNRKDIGLKRSIAKMKSRYRTEGFLGAEVRIGSDTRPAGRRTRRNIEIRIEEGDRLLIDGIQIAGNASIPMDRIEEQLLSGQESLFKQSYYVPEVLQEDIEAIRALYLKNGFASPEITSRVVPKESQPSATIHLDIEEGRQTMVSAIGIDGLTLIPEETAYNAIGLEAGKPFRSYMLKSDRNTLSSLVSEKGHPFVTVSSNVNESEDGASADVAYVLDEGLPVVNGQSYFAGNFRTREKTLQSTLALAPMQPFSPGKLLQGQKRLRDTGLFQTVRLRLIGFEEENDRVHSIVELSERKPFVYEAEAGYETQHGPFLHSKIADHNLWGRNREVWLGTDLSSIGHHISLGFRSPRFYSSRLSMEAALYTERREEPNQDFGTEVSGLSIGVIRKPFGPYSMGVNTRLEKRAQFSQDAAGIALGPEDDLEYQQRTAIVISPSISIDTRDSFIRPRKGAYVGGSIDMSKGLDTGIDDFAKVRLEAKGFFSPSRLLTLAGIARIGHIVSYHSPNDVPKDQLFFLGGAATVRGFEENLLASDQLGDPLGGRTAISASLEMRIDLGRRIEWLLFCDTGRIADALSEEVLSGFRPSVGAGLRYITPIGPIGLVYGHNLDPRPDETSGRLYFSIGYSF